MLKPSALVGLLFTAALGCRGGEAEKAAAGAPQPRIPVVTVEPKVVEVSAEYLGAIESRRSIEIRPQVASYVTKIHVRPGDKVDAGQLLLQLDASEQTAALAEARARLAQEEAQAELARSDVERATTLAKEGIVSRQERDRAEADAEAAKARVKAAQADVRARSAQRRFYDVLAPFAGVAGDIPVKIGDYVTPQTVLTIIDQPASSALSVSVDLPIARARSVEPGQTNIEVIGEGGEAIAKAPVTFISPRPEESTQLIRVKAELDEAGLLKQGQFVRARVLFGQEEALAVPSYAVTWLSGQAFVFVAAPMDGGGHLIRRQQVELSRLQDNEWLIKSGLRPGDQVAVGAIQMLQDGMPVVPVPAESKGEEQPGEGPGVGGGGQPSDRGR